MIHAWAFPYTGELPGLAVDRIAKESAIQAEELLRAVVGPAVERHPEIRVTTRRRLRRWWRNRDGGPRGRSPR